MNTASLHDQRLRSLDLPNGLIAPFPPSEFRIVQEAERFTCPPLRTPATRLRSDHDGPSLSLPSPSSRAILVQEASTPAYQDTGRYQNDLAGTIARLAPAHSLS